MYAVIARYQTQPCRGDDVAKALLDHITATRGEPGCVGFVVNRSVDDPDQFVLYEQYHDEHAFQAHLDSAHYQRYVVEQVRPLLSERQVSFYTTVEP
jgi:quinol monooxygenase YgiN